MFNCKTDPFIAMSSKNEISTPITLCQILSHDFFTPKKVSCSPLRYTFLHLKTILGMIAHINLKMTHEYDFFLILHSSVEFF